MSIVFSRVCNLVSAQVMDVSLQPSRFSMNVTISLDSKQCCAAIFIFLAKAFDTVDHSIRLRSIGGSEGALALFANYHSQRVQCIKSDNLLSQPLPVTKA